VTATIPGDLASAPKRPASLRRRRSNSLRRRSYLFGAMLVAPTLLLYGLFIIWPLIKGGLVSLYEWNGLSSTMTWVGFRNYREAFADPTFRLAMRNTVEYAVVVTVVKNILGLGLALLLNKKLKGLAFFRTAAFLPVMFSFVVVGVLWSWIFNPIFGLADHFIAILGIHQVPGWLSDPHLALWSVMWVDIWKWTGFHMVLYLAALQSIPKELYEAASIDGVTRWQRLRYVTIPGIRPVIAFSVLLALTGAFVANYDVVYVMTGGGPLNSTQVALTYIVQTAFSANEVGYANAMSMILLAVVAILGAVQLRVMLRGRDRFR
jgi:raffinose/stachyose/melibiose transport system permease protein